MKRLIGHPFDSDEVRAAAQRLPYALKASPLGSVLFEVGGIELTPVQVSAKILQRVREVAEKNLGEPVKQAVISVPAHFNDVQRKATKLAAEYAGLEVLRLINEPTAAAFAYGYKKHKDFTLAVYDLGGGTFDVTIMRARGDTFEVVATDGDSYLGGEDFDYAIAEWLEREFAAEHGRDLSGDPSARLRMKEAAEKAKVELSDVESTRIALPFLTQAARRQPPELRAVADPREARRAVQAAGRAHAGAVRALHPTARVVKGEIGEVLLVGGQSRMLSVREGVKKFFAKEPRRDINPDEVVAIGAALYAYSLTADSLKEEAVDAADDAYEVALRETAVARKILERGRADPREAARRSRPGRATHGALEGDGGRRPGAGEVRRAHGRRPDQRAGPDHVRRGEAGGPQDEDQDRLEGRLCQGGAEDQDEDRCDQDARAQDAAAPKTAAPKTQTAAKTEAPKTAAPKPTPKPAPAAAAPEEPRTKAKTKTGAKAPKKKKEPSEFSDLIERGKIDDEDLPTGVQGLKNELLQIDYKATELIEKLADELPTGAAADLLEMAKERLSESVAAAKGAAAGGRCENLKSAAEHKSARRVESEAT